MAKFSCTVSAKFDSTDHSPSHQPQGEETGKTVRKIQKVNAVLINTVRSVKLVDNHLQLQVFSDMTTKHMCIF